jgi:hypothetical protein
MRDDALLQKWSSSCRTIYPYMSSKRTVSPKVIPLANLEGIDYTEREKGEKEETTSEGQRRGKHPCHSKYKLSVQFHKKPSE